jgi:ADP-ribose pyrophosphatase YjhB (NUDIX family)
MKFCSNCGAQVTREIPPGDHLIRYCCHSCDTVHYQNPKLIVGCVATFGEHLLLCRRAIEPRRGFWTVPAGFMENGETLQQGAARECYEEALARVEIGSLLAVAHVLSAQQVHVFFRATMTDAAHSSGPESLETALVLPSAIPWEELAFPSTEFALRRYLSDLASGRELHHFATLERRLEQPAP